MMLSVAWPRTTRAEPYVPVSTSALLDGRAEEGVLTLHSGYRNHPYVDADAVVWLGNAGVGDMSADVLAVNVGLREPNGLGSARFGRFILATGAVRPVQLDGLRAVARAPFGTSVEGFFGAPVASSLSGGAFDWLAGSRVAQQLFEGRVAVGASYVHQRDAGMIANEEVGADFVVQPLEILWIRGVGSWDTNLEGLAAAQLQANMALPKLHVLAFAERRVAARLLPATSLFSTISDSANSELGADGDYQLFPRLSVGGRMSLQWIEGDARVYRGYRATARARLALGDGGDGQVLAELSRLGGLSAGYSAAYLALERAIGERFFAHAAGELVAADQPDGRGDLWPYLKIGLRYDSPSGLQLAGAVIARATPQYAHEVTGLVRLSYQTQVVP